MQIKQCAWRRLSNRQEAVVSRLEMVSENPELLRLRFRGASLLVCLQRLRNGCSTQSSAFFNCFKGGLWLSVRSQGMLHDAGNTEFCCLLFQAIRRPSAASPSKLNAIGKLIREHRIAIYEIGQKAPIHHG